MAISGGGDNRAAQYVEKQQKLLEKAIYLAVNGHLDVRDKQHKAYVLHVLRVMNAVEQRSGGNAEYMMAAVMHDLVEDTDMTLEDLQEAGFPQSVVDAVDALTKRPKENYITFVRRAAQNPIAKCVKMADVRDNLNRIPARLDTKWWQKLHLKYTVAIHILRGDQTWLNDNRELVAGLENA